MVSCETSREIGIVMQRRDYFETCVVQAIMERPDVFVLRWEVVFKRGQRES